MALDIDSNLSINVLSCFPKVKITSPFSGFEKPSAQYMPRNHIISGVSSSLSGRCLIRNPILPCSLTYLSRLIYVRPSSTLVGIRIKSPVLLTFPTEGLVRRWGTSTKRGSEICLDHFREGVLDICTQCEHKILSFPLTSVGRHP